MSTPIHQLVYISAAEHEFTEKELQELLVQARENNESLGITGMLLFHEGSFIQSLEGEKELVEKLYEKIGKDDRHSESRVIFRGQLAERDFDSWSMGFYRSTQSSFENLEGFHKFLKSGFRREARDDESLARKALLQFREGSWRQAVEI
tara:strand:+ start:1624 stop:2070 length:447 start_codon:yes stop_codon:yes gene_type:complete